MPGGTNTSLPCFHTDGGPNKITASCTDSLNSSLSWGTTKSKSPVIKDASRNSDVTMQGGWIYVAGLE